MTMGVTCVLFIILSPVGSLILGTGVAVNEYLLPEFVRKRLKSGHVSVLSGNPSNKLGGIIARTMFP